MNIADLSCLFNSVIKVSNLKSVSIDVDSLMKSAKATFTIFLGIRDQRKTCFCSPGDPQCVVMLQLPRKNTLLFCHSSVASTPSIIQKNIVEWLENGRDKLCEVL